MNRRSFVDTLGLGLLAAPLAAEAQQARKVWRIGVLGAVQCAKARAGASAGHV